MAPILQMRTWRLYGALVDLSVELRTWALVPIQSWAPLWAQAVLPGDNEHKCEGSQNYVFI